MRMRIKGRLLSIALSAVMLFSFPVTAVTAADAAAISDASDALPAVETTACENISQEEYTMPAVLTASDDLQTQLDALPDAEEISSMNTEAQNEVYALVSACWDAYYELSENEQSEVDTTTLEELSDYFSVLTSVTATTYYAQIGEKQYASIQDAIDAAVDGDTVQLLTNYTFPTTTTPPIEIPEGLEITLDLNGYKISRSISVKVATSVLINNGTLTIIDSSESQIGTIYAKIAGAAAGDSYYAAAIQNTGTLNLLGGTIETVVASTSYTRTVYGIVNTADGANITLNGATVSVTNPAASYSAIGIYNLVDNTSVTMVSGSVSVTSKANYPVVGIATASDCDSSSITVSGGTITVDATRTNSPYSGATAIGIDAKSGSTTVTGGSVTVSAEMGSAYGVKANSDSPANVDNLTLSVTSNATSSTASYDLMEYANITGGSYTMDGTTTLSASVGDGVTISGGTYSSNIEITGNVSAGYMITDANAVGLYLGISTNAEASVLATVVSGGSTDTMYAEVSAEHIAGYTKTAYPTTTLEFTGTDGKAHGYLFAGWYYKNDNGNYIAYGCEEADTDHASFGFNSTAYAKFVDAAALTVKVQITAGTSETSKSTSLRIISSVDTLVYQSIAFDITFNGKTITTSDTTAFQALAATDNVNEYSYTPSDIFSSASNYFITFTINNIPAAAFDYDFTILPSWTTTDGTMVSGTQRAISINDILQLLAEKEITNGSEQ